MSKKNISKSKKIKTYVGVCQWQTPTRVRKKQTSNKITNVCKLSTAGADATPRRFESTNVNAVPTGDVKKRRLRYVKNVLKDDNPHYQKVISNTASSDGTSF